MKITRRLFSLTTLPSLIAGLLWPTATQARSSETSPTLTRLPPTESPPVEPPEVFTPRISWEYTPSLTATVGADDTITNFFRWYETVLIRFHGMPTAYGVGTRLHYGVMAINFSRRHPGFKEPIRGCVHLDDAIKQIERYKTSYAMLPAEAASLDRLIELITPGHEIDQKPPLAMRQFVVNWSGQPESEPTA